MEKKHFFFFVFNKFKWIHKTQCNMTTKKMKTNKAAPAKWRGRERGREREKSIKM